MEGSYLVLFDVGGKCGGEIVEGGEGGGILPGSF